VGISPTADASEKTKSAANALLAALKSVNMDATLGNDEADNTLLSMTIGIKP